MLFLSVEYPYMAQLRELDRRSGSSAGELPPSATAVVTPMREAEWAAVLHEHPDREWVQHLRAGIRNGFRVGFSGERVYCHQLFLAVTAYHQILVIG